MPCSVGVWVVDEDNWFTVFVDESLITEEGAQLLEAALSSTADKAIWATGSWARSS